MNFGILSDSTVAMSSFDWKPLVFDEDEKFERNIFWWREIHDSSNKGFYTSYSLFILFIPGGGGGMRIVVLLL